jgi:hypothetical protein
LSCKKTEQKRRRKKRKGKKGKKRPALQENGFFVVFVVDGRRSWIFGRGKSRLIYQFGQAGLWRENISSSRAALGRHWPRR